VAHRDSEEHSYKRVRVVVAGVGAVTALGSSATQLWEGVKAGRVAITPVQSLPMESYITRLGGEVREMIPAHHTYQHPVDHKEPTIDFALAAAEEALQTSTLRFDQVPAERWGLVVGTCMGGLQSARKWYMSLLHGQTADRRLLSLITPQALAETIGGAFGLQGPLLSLSTACAAGANAIGYAAEIIRSGRADIMLAGGSDALVDILFAGFHCLESLSPAPAAPYSYQRSGLSLGEGSGMVVVVREDLARRFATPILAEVLGYGLSADGYHPTAPDPVGQGAARAITAALAAAGIKPAQVSYINGHGTGTAKNDPAETKAIRLALQDAADHVAVSSTKSMIGHLLGAAGAVEAIVTIKALQEQIAPPTANYSQADPDCDLDYVPNVARPLSMEVALSNNFAFGGNNASLVLGRTERDQAHHLYPAPHRERVVITGMATLTAQGCDIETVWHNLRAGHSYAQREQNVWVGRVKLDPAPFLTARERRRMDRQGIFSIVSSRIALQDAGIAINAEKRDRMGILFGTGLGPLESLENFCRPLFLEGTRAANPAIFPNTVFNAAAGLVAMHTHLVGPTSTITTGHAAGASALCYGYDLVASGQADSMLCLAVDTLTDSIIHGYRDSGLLAKEEHGSLNGGGFMLAEGAVALVLEGLTSARLRGAHIYGEVLGYGIASDVQNSTRHAYRSKGIERAMQLALNDSALDSNQRQGQHGSLSFLAHQGTIWANAAGYRAMDTAEQDALQHLFGPIAQTEISPELRADYDGPIQVITAKKLLGEPCGVGGALNTALALKAWQWKRAHANEMHHPFTKEIALVNSSSLGGTHFSIALGSYQEEGEKNA
jgi:3-oxoacyl-[acyl-carrier-protein] synthase II